MCHWCLYSAQQYCIILRINNLFIVVYERFQLWFRLGKLWCFQKWWKVWKIFSSVTVMKRWLHMETNALSIKSKCFNKMGLVIMRSKKGIMLSLQMLKSLLEIVVEIWLECLAVKNSPEKLIHFQSSTGPNLFWAVSLVRPTLYHFNFPNFKSHLAKSNQNSGLNLNRMLWPSWKLCFKNNVITFLLGKIYWFLTSLFGKMASTPMMPSMHKWLKCYVTNSMNIRGYKEKRHCYI